MKEKVNKGKERKDKRLINKESRYYMRNVKILYKSSQFGHLVRIGEVGQAEKCSAAPHSKKKKMQKIERGGKSGL